MREPLNVGPRGTKILRAARALFIREGGSQFSARGVAKEAGISLGAVQYIFPTKDLLLAGMLQYVLEEYEAVYRRVTIDLPFNGEARLLGVVDHLIADLWRDQTRRFFFNFWALGCHNRFAAKLLDATYAHHRRRIAAYIGAARPALSEQFCLELALQVSALLDGFMIYTSPTSPLIKRQHIAQMARTAVLTLLDTQSIGIVASIRAGATL
jgi:AcrR family transcriptional regulator